VLKHSRSYTHIIRNMQPPSGGCVLKQVTVNLDDNNRFAATFGWLCVETQKGQVMFKIFFGSHLRVAVC